MTDLRKKRTPKPVPGPSRELPACPRGCGFRGWPNAETTPYVGDCGGDPTDQSKHVRVRVES